MTCFYASVLPAASASANATPFAQLSIDRPKSRCLHKPETDGVLSEWQQKAAARARDL